MQLASAEVISELLNRQSTMMGQNQTAPNTARRSSAGRKRRCRCGECAECRENARWERIFAEKFADPDYYTLQVPRAVSPLTSL